MAGPLAGRVALVTGGGTGIGEAISRRFAAAGARVVIAGLAEADGRVAAGIGGTAVRTDIADEAQVAALFAGLDRLDALVNNAGLGGGVMAVEEMDLAAWEAIFAVNVRGTLLCIKHAVPLLRRQGGAIVNIASRAGLRGIGFQGAYSASKAAVIGITMTVAQEVGRHGIRVNALCPGVVDTDLYRANAAQRAARAGVTVEEDRARLERLAALRRLASREEVAEAALFLAGDEGAAITGEAIRIDGGRF